MRTAAEPDRRSYLGGPDAAAILGADPWRTSLDVIAHKRGDAPDKEPNWPMKCGLVLEGLLLDDYAERTGLRVVKQPGFISHPRHPWAGGHIDGEVPTVPRIIECKTTQSDEGWGDEGTEIVPDRVFIQSAWYMAIRDVAECDVVVLIRNRDRFEYRLHRDLTFESYLFATCEEFWQRYVVGDETPPLDGSESTHHYLEREFPRHGSAIVPGDAAAIDAARELRQAREMERAAKERASELEARLKVTIGAAAGIDCGALGRITWKRSADAMRLDVKALKADLEAAALVKRHTVPTPGARRFVVPRAWGHTEED